MRYRHVRETVLNDAMKIARAKEKIESAIAELQSTVQCLEEILREQEEGGADDVGR